MVWHLDVGLSFPKSVGSLIGGSVIRCVGCNFRCSFNSCKPNSNSFSGGVYLEKGVDSLYLMAFI